MKKYTDYTMVARPHTAMIRITARLNETRAYIRNHQAGMGPAELRKAAWTNRWFGFIPESSFDSLAPALYNRFGKFPGLMEVLRTWLARGMEPRDFKLVCHLHILLSDPYYRWAAGEYIPARVDEGLEIISRPALARALAEKTVNPLGAGTLQKLARNILTTARDVGLLKGKNEKIAVDPAPGARYMGYAMYTLGMFDFAMSNAPDSSFFKSVFRAPGTARALLARGRANGWWEHHWEGDLFEIDFAYADVGRWFNAVFK
ncbi:MAG: hypothetical protein GY859_30030 [Desulfobacterales bacterium]|nr:hypothetical protein [Desulfobacterales bacterium]